MEASIICNSAHNYYVVFFHFYVQILAVVGFIGVLVVDLKVYLNSNRGTSERKVSKLNHHKSYEADGFYQYLPYL